MEKAVWCCERCDAEHNEKQWRQFQRDARWYPTAGLTDTELRDIARYHVKARATDPTVRSYWRNGFNRLLPVTKGYRTALHEIVAKGEAAKSSQKALKIWKQEEEATLWDPTTEGEAPPPWKPIYDRREDYGLTVPEGGLFLTCFVDCQLNRLECGWRAWGRNEESWGLDHVVLDGHVRDPEVWQMLRHELARKWQHSLGVEITLGMGFIDGGHYAEDVYRFFQNLARNPVPNVNGHIRASKGIGQHGHPVVTRKMMTIAKNLKGHHLGTWEAKDRIYERLRMEVNGAGDTEPHADGVDIRDHVRGAQNQREAEKVDAREGWYHFNHRYTEEYFQQLTVEQVTVTFERGLEIRKYVNPQQARNEALDIEVGNLAAFRLFPRNFDLIEAELRQRAADAQRIAQGKQPVEQQPSRQRENGNWMGDMGRGFIV
jgi:phage terminase large subunit GpA-like protein